MSVGIAAIFKNEMPYIIEWIAFHRVVNINNFFIADNNSTDGSTELLRALDAAGIINLIDFPSRTDQSTQLAAYSELIRVFGSKVNWVAFIDADEFMMPQGVLKTVPQLTDAIGEYAAVGAIVLNWAIYGSNGYSEPNPGLVTERFQLRAEKSFTTNCHYKSIVRTSAFKSVGKNPHYFELREGFRSVHSNGSHLRNPVVPGISEKIVWDNLRLNHYVVKSRREFIEKKQPRGRADMSPQIDFGYFHHHDRNEELDLINYDLIAKVRSEIAVIENLVGVNFPTSAFAYWREFPALPKFLISRK